MPESSEQLRARAASLRRGAGTIGGLGLAEVSRLIGPDTWVGPTATAFAAEIERARRRLELVAEELVRGARRLERDADRLDAATRSPAGSS